MIFQLTLLLPYFLSANAAPAIKAAVWAGGATSDVWTASAIASDATLFPSPSQVGFGGPTPTGAEAMAIATAAVAPLKADTYPLAPPQMLMGTKAQTTSSSSSSFSPARSWGNLSPWFSVDSAVNGLPGASAQIPDGCELTQVHMIQRHGARYPATGDPPSKFADSLHSVANSTGFTADGPLAFLTNWTYKLGAETLTPFGRQQLFDRGSSFRVSYGGLLDNFTTLPVFRTTTEDRMVDSAMTFAAGFFGVREYPTSYNLVMQIEGEPYNTTLAPYDNCLPNGDTWFDLGSKAQDTWIDTYLKNAVTRLQPSIQGMNLSTTNLFAMQNLCAYETVALGFSSFCGLFNQEEWQGFGYATDLKFWYSDGPGNPVTSAQGIGYVKEMVARLTNTPLTTFDASLNATQDGNNVTFPLNDPIYFDFTHDTVIAAIISAMNLTSFNAAGPLPLTEIPSNHTYQVQNISPFASQLLGQVMSCPASGSNSTMTPSIRWILNDAVVPLTGINQCASFSNKDGMCPLDAFISGMQTLIDDEDWTYDCMGNYTVSVPNTIVNGKAPLPK